VTDPEKVAEFSTDVAMNFPSAIMCMVPDVEMYKCYTNRSEPASLEGGETCIEVYSTDGCDTMCQVTNYNEATQQTDNYECEAFYSGEKPMEGPKDHSDEHKGDHPPMCEPV